MKHSNIISQNGDGKILDRMDFTEYETGWWIEGDTILKLGDAYAHNYTAELCGFEGTWDFVRSGNVTRVFQSRNEVGVYVNTENLRDVAYYCVMAEGAESKRFTFECNSNHMYEVKSYTYAELLEMA